MTITRRRNDDDRLCPKGGLNIRARREGSEAMNEDPQESER
jgi:hypothetical protein